MKHNTFFLTTIAFLLFLTSCKKSAISSSDLQFQVQTVNRSANINAPVAISNIQWTSGFASANQIKLEGKSNNSEVEFKSGTSQRIDLFAPVAAALGNISLPTGTYSEVEFKIEMSGTGNTTTLQLNGQFTNAAGNVTPVTFTVNSLLEIKAEQNNVTITNNAGTVAITTLNLAALTTGITQTMLNNATVSGGAINISASSNSSIYAIILGNLQLSHEVEVHH